MPFDQHSANRLKKRGKDLSGHASSRKLSMPAQGMTGVGKGKGGEPFTRGTAEHTHEQKAVK